MLPRQITTNILLAGLCCFRTGADVAAVADRGAL
jgi:hypothetical protein